MVQAQEIRADQAANAANQPGVGASGNGVPLINIVTPNGAGLSHNKYSDFNVGPNGAILNNSNQDLLRSQLGGLVQGNGNLRNSGPASVILNEVTGSSRSVLEGAVEVHGKSANVVIANPHGLTCNGCGFINTPRVTLSTGVPEIGADGSLSGLRVEGGDVRIGANGADLGSVNIFDIVSRRIAIDGPVKAGGDLTLVAGRNSYAYQSGLVTPLASDGDEPAIAIDSSLLGGMYAGSIKIISTDKGAGVKMSGQMAANAGAMTLSSNGKLTLGKAQAKQAITARSQKQAVRVESTLFSDEAITLEGLSGVELADSALVVAKGDVSLRGETVALGVDALAASGTDSSGQQAATGTLSIEASALSAGQGQLAAGGLLSIKANTIDLAQAADTGRDTLRSRSDIVIEAASIDARKGRITAGGGLTVKSANSLTMTDGRYVAGGMLLAQAAQLTSSASLAAGSVAKLETLNGNLNHSGEIAGNGGTVLSSSQDITNSGRVVSTDKVTLATAGTLRNNSAGLVAADGGVTVSAGSIANDGSIAAQGGTLDVTAQNDISNAGKLLSMKGASVTAGGKIGNSGDLLVEDALSLRAANSIVANSGTINAGAIGLEAASLVNQGLLTAHDQSVAVSLSGNLQNAGEISARNAIGLAVDGNVTLSGTLKSNDTLSLTGRDNGRAGSVSVLAGGVVNGGTALSLRAASLDNAGSVGSASGSLLAELAGNLSNTGLLYSGTSSSYLLDGSFTNVNADVLAETDLAIKGLSGARAGALDNRSGTIEAVAGDMAFNVASLTNRRDGLTSTVDTTTEITQSGDTTTTVVTKREMATANGPASQLLAGGDITIDTGVLTNSYSQIAANGDIAITAASILNEGRDLVETVETTAVTQHSERYCAKRILGICVDHDTRRWTTTDSSTSSRTYDAVFGTIEAGGALSANVTGYLNNNAVRSQAGQIGLSSGDRALSAADVASASQARNLASLSAIDVSINALIGRQATFQQVAAPNMPYLIETRSEFIDPSKFLGSDYFLQTIGSYNPDVPLKRLGDAYVEYRLIRDQIFNLTGSRSVGSGLDPYRLVQALYDNAADAQQELGLTFGVSLTPSQRAALTKDIVWLEKQIVDGQEVLVPRVYLSSSTTANTSLASAQIRAGQASIETAALTNSGAISTTGNLAIDTTAALFNNGGSLFAGADIVIDAGSIFSNRSGTVSGRNVTVEADTIVNDTVKIRDVYANGFADRAQQAARIEAREDLLLKASGSIVSEGGQFVAGDDMTLDAGEAIDISALELERSRDDKIKGGYDRAYSLTNTLAELQAGGNLLIDAGDDLALRGARASAGENVTLQADGDVSITSVQNRENRDLKLDIKTSGFLGTETNIRRQSSSVETEATTITAGKDVSVISESGDVALQAPHVKSGGETRLEAEEGKVALLTNTDQSFKQDFKREEDLFWWNERDQGKAEETIRHVEIEAGGGLKIDAGNGIVIEYHKTGNLEASLDQLAQSPGLAWVGEIRNDPALAGQVDWKAVDAQFQQWDYKSQGLTEAGAALVTLVATALTAGAGGFTASLSNSLASSLGIQNAAMQTALNAGVQSLINKTAVALVNNQGDLGAALKELGSSANIRALLTSMVAAGLTTQVAGMMELQGVSPGASFQDNLVNVAQQKLIEASIRAGVDMTIGGENPVKALANAFRSAAAGTIGTVLANQIGDYAAFNGVKDGDIQKVVLHALAGCAAGAAGSGDCVAGAIGSGLGELLGKPIAEAIPDPARQTALLSLIAGAAGALATGSSSAVDAAANTAATTHQYNYLNHEELQAALANRKALERCTQLGSVCSREEISALINKDAGFVDLSQTNTSTLLQVCLAAPASQACSSRIADLKGFASRLESERDTGLVFADPTNSASGFSVKQSIFDYDLLLARSLMDGSKSPDIAIRDFVVDMSKREGAVNGFLSAVGVVGGVGVCASGVGTMACAAGALGALASGNHLYGDVQQALTGNEARTVLVQALTSSGLSLADARKYQAYVDAGVVVVTLGVVGGQAVYRFTVNSAKVSTADRATLEILTPQNAANFERQRATYAAQEILNAKPVGSALKDDPLHRAASYVVDRIPQDGRVFTIRGNDGQSYNLTQMVGSVDGKAGIFEWIVDAQKQLTHQRFIPGGRINGTPNQIPSKMPN
ncbi:hypothetical protein RS75_14965 [Rhizobium nepotum 39/7]|uniref:Filamentous haemagglutinin FhaB/tRNA nuclease CdiA-like TPS domain-containing protein n=2 Tax=Rhizobium nepotum TaxID=1035271 RepID=A0ABR5CQ13_9HYPH|nr:hypothetical protein RS75_14965 [Rhizobium nepotum 39/7]